MADWAAWSDDELDWDRDDRRDTRKQAPSLSCAGRSGMTRKYRAEQIISISASESGTEVELQMVVAFNVHPGAKATMIDPPEGPVAEVNELRFFLIKDGKPSPTPASLPVWMINFLTDNNEFHDWMLSEAAEQYIAAAEDHADHRLEMMREEF